MELVDVAVRTMLKDRCLLLNRCAAIADDDGVVFSHDEEGIWLAKLRAQIRFSLNDRIRRI